MGVEMIKDSKGKPHMVFNKDNSKEDELMGDKIEDFEILQVLGEGSFGFVAKAKSKLNHKIYAIKQIDFSSLKGEKAMELCQNEIITLKNLNHPLITKYYKSIKEGNCLYIIMEFMDNGDLGGLIKAHKSLKKPISEEKIMNIFIQAMKSLTFIHSHNLIHRDIKPENLFISNDGTLKLGDFGVSASIVEKKDNNKYKNIQEQIQKELISKWICKGTCVGTPPFMSPEMLQKSEYNLNSDVYSMGCTFFETMFWIFPRAPVIDIEAIMNGKGEMKLVDLPIKNNENYYSKELVDIVKKMIEKDKNKRPNSEQILKMLMDEYNKKFSRNSSIGSILSCLFSNKELTDFFIDPNNKLNITNDNFHKQISFAYIYGINEFNNGEANENWNNSLCDIREILIKNNNKYEGHREINPKIFLSYLIGKIHHELNTCKIAYINPFSRVFTNAFSSKDNNSSYVDYSDKIKSLNLFTSAFNKSNSSIMSDLLYAIMRTKTACEKCQTVSYIYYPYYLIAFDLNIMQSKKKQNNQTHILDCFKMQNETKIKLSFVTCNKCKEGKTHWQLNQFYNFPKFMIISLDRGFDCKNKMKISYDINLYLRGNCYDPNSPLNYRLIGIVKRLDKGEKEHYISIYFNHRNNSWIERDGSNCRNIDSPLTHQQGIEVMLFYIENKMNINPSNQFNNNDYFRLNSNMNLMNNNNNNFNSMNNNNNNIMSNNLNNMNNMNNNMNFNFNNNFNVGGNYGQNNLNLNMINPMDHNNNMYNGMLNNNNNNSNNNYNNMNSYP